MRRTRPLGWSRRWRPCCRSRPAVPPRGRRPGRRAAAEGLDWAGGACSAPQGAGGRSGRGQRRACEVCRGGQAPEHRTPSGLACPFFFRPGAPRARRTAPRPAGLCRSRHARLRRASRGVPGPNTTACRASTARLLGCWCPPCPPARAVALSPPAVLQPPARADTPRRPFQNRPKCVRAPLALKATHPPSSNPPSFQATHPITPGPPRKPWQSRTCRPRRTCCTSTRPSRGRSRRP